MLMLPDHHRVRVEIRDIGAAHFLVVLLHNEPSDV